MTRDENDRTTGGTEDDVVLPDDIDAVIPPNPFLAVPAAHPVAPAAEPEPTAVFATGIRELMPHEMEIPDPNHPTSVFERIGHLWSSREHGGTETLLHHLGEWMTWRGTHWEPLSAEGINSDLYKLLRHTYYLDNDARGKERRFDWAPTRSKITNMAHAMAGLNHLPDETEFPCWRDGRASGTLLSCANGLLDVNTREIQPHDARYLNTNAVPYAYDPDAPKPVKWLAFLDSLWKEDPESIRVLQEWLGYLLSGRTDLQKMFLITGPSRSGKGTIMKIASELVGRGNTVGATLATFGTDFGLAGFIGKSLAAISDARLDNNPNTEMIMERLLMISGEDTIPINRKYKKEWTGRLGTRVMMMANAFPNFTDASGALLNRFIVLRTTKTFLGHENFNLERELVTELSAILNWALEGLDRLVARGRFGALPESAASSVEVMREVTSPVSVFVDEHCLVTGNPETWVRTEELYRAWEMWCMANGKRAGSLQRFTSNLTNAFPTVVKDRRMITGERAMRYHGISLVTGQVWSPNT